MVAVELLDDRGRLDARHDVGLHRDGRQAMAAPDQRRARARRRASRSAPAARCVRRRRSIIRLRSVSSFARSSGNGAGHDVDQIGAVAHLGDLGAGQHGVDVVRQLLRADAERAGAILVHLDLDDLGRLVPVVVDVAGVGVAAEHLRERLRDLARLDRIGAADAELAAASRPAVRARAASRAPSARRSRWQTPSPAGR